MKPEVDTVMDDVRMFLSLVKNSIFRCLHFLLKVMILMQNRANAARCEILFCFKKTRCPGFLWPVKRRCGKNRRVYQLLSRETQLLIFALLVLAATQIKLKDLFWIKMSCCYKATDELHQCERLPLDPEWTVWVNTVCGNVCAALWSDCQKHFIVSVWAEAEQLAQQLIPSQRLSCLRAAGCSGKICKITETVQQRCDLWPLMVLLALVAQQWNKFTLGWKTLSVEILCRRLKTCIKKSEFLQESWS